MYAEPASVEEICALVRDAAARGEQLRVFGTRYCFNEIANTRGVHLNLQHMPREIRVLSDFVTVDGGATYIDVDAALEPSGMALANLASLPHITVAGAIATATHGSGFGNACLADAVRAMTFVNARGECVTRRRGDAGFENYPVHLAIFGPSHERLTHFRSDFAPSVGDEVQSEYLIPRAFATAALRTLPQFTETFSTLAHDPAGMFRNSWVDQYLPQ